MGILCFYRCFATSRMMGFGSIVCFMLRCSTWDEEGLFTLHDQHFYSSLFFTHSDPKAS